MSGDAEWDGEWAEDDKEEMEGEEGDVEVAEKGRRQRRQRCGRRLTRAPATYARVD